MLALQQGAIPLAGAAKWDTVNAAAAKTLADLAASLEARNAAEPLDDPIRIAATSSAVAAAVKSAWQNVQNLQARAPETFVGMTPGWTMGLASYINAGLSFAVDLHWES